MQQEDAQKSSRRYKFVWFSIRFGLHSVPALDFPNILLHCFLGPIRNPVLPKASKFPNYHHLVLGWCVLTND